MLVEAETKMAMRPLYNCGWLALVMMSPAAALDVGEGLESIGKPQDGLLGFQPPTTEIARDAFWLDDVLLYIITAICILVLGLLAWVVLRYNKARNPVPSRVSHFTPVEVAWTLIPALILVGIGTISLPILFEQQTIPETDVTIKATGNQWYWSYEYPDHEFSFDSFMLQREELADHGYTQDEYLLATDTALVLPVGKSVAIYVTASDVIHAWTVPSFGVKQDGVPGRLAGLWFTPEVEGIFFGQCSELCGKDHAYMPITVKVVSEDIYERWLDQAIAEYAGIPSMPSVFAANEY